MNYPSHSLLVPALVVLLLLAGCSSPQAPAPAPATTAPQPTSIVSAGAVGTAGSPYGTILVDFRGKTLYFFADDVPGSGTSACTGACAALWPPIAAETAKVTSPLTPAEFGSITRADGSPQTTYHGRPLYYYAQDSRAGDVNGEGTGNAWFVARTGLRVNLARNPLLGLYLTDGAGKTLYTFRNDTAGTSACTGTCSVRWPALAADPVTAPSILKPADFGTITRGDGTRQTTYRGWPLYTFAGDGNPGEANGQGFGSVWYVAGYPGEPAPTPSVFHTLSPSGGGTY
jgi:predicted lipoprotein with Yx(FWY)xxD motif